MRLTCPNCSAQYEVPDEVIPLDGRDVQCSNCGHTWYQEHPDRLFEEEEEIGETAASDIGLRAALTDDDWEEYEYEAEPGPEPEPEPAPEPEWEAEAEPEPELVAAGEDAFYTEEAPELPPARPALDHAVSDILREEAEREAQLRAAEAGGLESQPELGLESHGQHDAERRAQQARDRMARFHEDEEEARPEAHPAAHPASRRDLLPDIEEINSTLRATGGPARPAAGHAVLDDDAAPQRRGMMRGFAVALLIGAALLLIYGNAPRIARSLPQADPMLSAYVAMVDQARYWLDGKLGGFAAD